MQRIALVLVGLIAVSLAKVPLYVADSSTAIDGEYIFVFHRNVTEDIKTTHIKTLMKAMDSSEELLNHYSIGSFRAFGARVSLATLNAQREHDDVLRYIETNQEVSISATCSSQNAENLWGLDRIDQTAVKLDNKYHHSSTAGADVEAYIVDTGIHIQHTDFQGRAKWGANFADNQNTDCNGHGTHVAGTVGGKTYGVAKHVHLIAVKVLNCQGSGTNNGVIAGIDYVASSAAKSKKRSVANMSLGGSKSTAINEAVAEAIGLGVTFVVAAGNENQDACNTSPASVSTAITVGATAIDAIGTSQTDVRADFSNWGKCVHIMAPGDMIKSAWIGSNSATLTISGTSMASPHVAGAAAVYLGDHKGATPDDVKKALIGASTAGKINMACSGSCNTATPNKLLFSACS